MQAHELIQNLFHELNREHADLQRPLPLDQAGAEWQVAADEVNAFLGQVVATLTTLDRAVTTMGVKEALHVLQLRRLTAIMEGQNSDVKRLSEGTEELARGVTKVAEDTHQAAEAAGRMREAGERSLEAVTLILGAIDQVEGQAKAVQDSFAHLVEQTRQAAAGLKAVQGVAGTSRLLALNAAIQAAHANDRSFAVVAQEMRRLADRTEQLVKQIEQQVASMETAIATMSDATAAMAETAARTGSQAREATGGLNQVQVLLNEVSGAVESIAAVAEEQAAATEEMAATAQDLNGRIQEASESMNLTRNLAVSEITEQAQAALGRFYIGSQADRMRMLLKGAVEEAEAILERAVAGREVRLEDLWDYQYQEIKGSAIASLGRLFRVDRVPPQGFTPPKYRTGYDHLIDRPLIDVMDRTIAEGGLQFSTVLDLNAFTVAHGRNMAADWTGNHEQDLRTNRIKRLFNTDPSPRKAARVGLPPALIDKLLITRQDLAGLPGQPAERPFLLQTYALDSGDVVLAMAMPLYVRGRQWGAIRIGYQPKM
ncbi:MAG: methyl-accepting chemotaxis protein [Bacillota bacterium]